MAEVGIDTSTIEGYADMSAEDKVKALEAFKFNDVSAELKASQEEAQKLKDATNKATHEAADFKKQLKELQNRSSSGQSESDKTIAALKSQVEELQKTSQLASLKAVRLSLGYSSEMAEEYAQAQLDGDFSKVAEIEKKFLEQHDKDYKSELLKNTPKPGHGGEGTLGDDMTLDKFKKLSAVQRIAFAQQNPNKYMELHDQS